MTAYIALERTANTSHVVAPPGTSWEET